MTAETDVIAVVDDSAVMRAALDHVLVSAGYRTELYACDELFLCGTGAQVSPVISVDRRQIGSGEVGQLTRKLQEVYFSAVRGEDARFRDWLVPVY